MWMLKGAQIKGGSLSMGSMGILSEIRVESRIPIGYGYGKAARLKDTRQLGQSELRARC
jgi:hypothetical protein